MDRRYLRSAVPMPSNGRAGVTPQTLYDALAQLCADSPFRLDSGLDIAPLVQANIYSGLVSNVLTFRVAHRVGGHQPANDTKWPDIILKDKTPFEVKASKHAFKGGESHSDNPGWMLVVGYSLNSAGKIDITTACLAHLERSDWKRVVRSGTSDSYETTPLGTAKLRDATFYLDSRHVAAVNFLRERLKIGLTIPVYSPFAA